MAAPNIDMIATSLRGCSLGGGAAPSPFLVTGRDPAGEGGGAAAAAAVAADTTLELNSDVALPYHWEQCLDLKTGKIYYINWSTGAKSMEDPRKFAGFGSGYCSDENGDDEDGDDADDEDDGDETDDGDDSSEEDGAVADSDEFGNCSSFFSSSSSASSRDTIERGGNGRGRGTGAGAVLVAAGCRVCMMYVMIPKTVRDCPRCGGHVLHFTTGGGR